MAKRALARRIRKTANTKGLTVLELIVALAIIGVIASMLACSIPKMMYRGRAKAARAAVELFATAESMVQTSTGRYTMTLEELKQVGVPGGFGNSWSGPYVVGITTTDPWGHPYFYASWYGGDGDVPTQWESTSLWELAMRGSPILDTGPLVRETGQPLEVQYSFGARAGDHLLRVLNDGITAAWISVNGVEVVGPSEFKHWVTEITHEIDLENLNTLSIRLASGPGNSARVVIETYFAPALPSQELAGVELGWYSVFGGSPNVGFVLGSYGADGAPGGTGSAADIIYGLPAQ